MEVRRYSSLRGVWQLIGGSLAGVIFLLAVLVDLLSAPPFILSACLTVLFIALVASAYFLYTLFGGKRVDVYVVRVNGRFGYANVAASLDTETAQQVVNSIEAARQGRETSERFPYHVMSNRLDALYYYADPHVLVTRQELTIQDKTYVMSEVRRAFTLPVTIDSKADVIDAIDVLGLVAVAVTILLSSIYDWRLSSLPLSPIFMWWGVHFVLLIMKGTVTRPYVYLLRLSLGFGKVTTAYASINEQYLSALSDIINTAHKDYEDAKQSARRASRWSI